MSATWSIGLSRASAGWTLPSTTAGTEGHPGPVTEQSADSYAATFDTNVLGTLLSMKHELRVMQAQGTAASSTSLRPMATRARGASVYSASKHAVEGLTKSAALEAAGSGVRSTRSHRDRSRPKCSTASPAAAERKAGLVAGVPLQRAGEPDEIANAIVFLASDKSSFTTGQVLSVDGGKSAT